jgi:type IX secretion system PorP/SprF family membrane protein
MKIKASIIILLIELLCICTVTAQRLPFFSHYYNNPYLYNPAYAGYDKHTVLYLTHRQQWFGVEGAPVSSQLSFHSPLGNANPLYIGGDIINDQLGSLSHTAVKFSAAYVIPLSSENEHYIKTGFSAGLGMHSYDFDGMDIGDDPVLQGALGSTMYLDGRFGIRYHNQGFNLSISLPHLFNQPAVLMESFSSPGIDQLSRMILSTHYRFNFGEENKLGFEPTILYHYSREGESQLEGMGVFYFKDVFWAGGSYQQQSGIGGVAGLQVKNLKFSYAYSTGGSEIAAYGMGSHEIQLGLVIGKKKEMLKRKPRLSTQKDIDEIPDEALLEKHAKSQEKSEKQDQKKETVPDRKRPAPAATTPAGKNNLPTEQKELNTEQQAGKNLVPADLMQMSGGEAAESQEKSSAAKEDLQPKQLVSPTEFSNANKQTAVRPQTKETPTGKKRDYSKLDFDTFENTDTEDGVIQLGEQQENSSHQQSAKTNEEEKNSVPDMQADTEPHPLKLKGGFYIIAGTFSTQENAEKQAVKLKNEGFSPEVGYHQQKKYYYVHVFQGQTKELALSELEKLRQHSAFSNAWILNVPQ